ncbi:hypothetical protein LY90DRAFT_509869 [Neocallimastix californiae]|uniref:Uncharacterized protein n=1 Tax=Neocallimastix californiae TaxID=1754190 RepID=A0A1Y2C870_9FUNG|nr:hypothetical protein LY90DRAFT_509869 [Neocallimastix californiae]|eukprot:ORY43230.1 hypothetical protein LY90DRAFT_509869 [Neocallimastix californiae]
MILNQEDINIYLEDKLTKEFYDEYNKKNINIEKLLKLSKYNKIYLYEPLKLDHYLLIDISLYCHQKFEIINIDQFNRYIDLINYFYKLYNNIKIKGNLNDNIISNMFCY